MVKLGELIELNKQLEQVVLDNRILISAHIHINKEDVECHWYAYSQTLIGADRLFFERITSASNLDNALAKAKKIFESGYKVNVLEKHAEKWVVEIIEVKNG